MAERIPHARTRLVAISLIGWLAAPLPALAAPPTVSVLLGGLSSGSQLQVTDGKLANAPTLAPTSSGIRLTAEGNVVAIRTGAAPVRRRERVTLVAVSDRMTVGVPGAESARTVTVPITVHARQGRLLVVADMPEPRYVAGVVDGEMTPAAPHQALRAQAIVARSYLYQSRRRHQRDDAWVCDQSHCQIWHPQANPHIAAAVADSTGLIVVGPRGKAVPVYYHASCGGSTVPVHLVFGGQPQPHLGGIADPGCQAERGWETTMPMPECVTALQQAQLIGTDRVTALSIGDRTPSGWPVSLRVDGTSSRSISAYQAWLAFGRAWGWGKLPGLHFDLSPTGDTVTFHGRGIGHGIGLCQRGCMMMAKQGKGAEAILATYFPGTRVGRP